jgi:hypothetical protein
VDVSIGGKSWMGTGACEMSKLFFLFWFTVQMKGAA